MSGVFVLRPSDSMVDLAKGCSADSPRPVPAAARYPSKDICLTREARVIALLDLLEVKIDAFAVCAIEDRCGLVVPPFDKLIVHYVLKGEGTIVSDRGSLAIEAGMVVVIPRGLAKQINGRGPVHTLCDADPACPIAPGIIKFSVPSNSEGDLILGCASVDASLGHRLSLFEHLTQPLALAKQNQIANLTFNAILQEFSDPDIGTKALVNTLMKHILLLLLRDNLKRPGMTAPIEPTAADSRITQAITIIMARPHDPHSVDNLAREVGMSRSCFSRSFAEAVGMSPMRYVQGARLRLASALLKCSTVPIKSIASSVGYASRSQFSRAFALMFGTDPTTFRNQTDSAAVASTDWDSAKPSSATAEPTPAA